MKTNPPRSNGYDLDYWAERHAVQDILHRRGVSFAKRSTKHRPIVDKPERSILRAVEYLKQRRAMPGESIGG